MKSTTTDLLERWLQRDETAGAELYERYRTRVIKFSRKWTTTEQEAEEVTAQSFASGLGGLRSGKSPANFTQWIFGVAKHVAAQEHRRTSREREVFRKITPSEPTGVTTSVSRRELSKLLEGAIVRLSPSCREVIDLLYHDQLSREDIAIRLNLDPASLDRRFARAFDMLRAVLRNDITTRLVEQRPPSKPVTLIRVQRLRPSFRDAFTRHHLRGEPIPHIALTLDLPEAVIRARLDEAYKLLGCRRDDDFSAVQAEFKKAR